MHRLGHSISCTQEGEIITEITEEIPGKKHSMLAGLCLESGYATAISWDNYDELTSTLEGMHDTMGIVTQNFSVPCLSKDNKTVFSFSKYVLSREEAFLLSFGLDFCLPKYKPCYSRFFLPLELLFHNLCNFQVLSKRVDTVVL